MKIYKLKELDYFTVAFSKTDAVFVFLSNKIGVTEENIEELEFPPNRDAIGNIFVSLQDLNDYEINY